MEMSNGQVINTWTFISKCSVPKEMEALLVAGEEVTVAYKTIRDTAVFTNKRILIKDTQGITGKKKEIYTIPYSSIYMYSTENAGIVDLSAEIELWTKAGRMKIQLRSGIDVREIDKIIAQAIL